MRHTLVVIALVGGTLGCLKVTPAVREANSQSKQIHGAVAKEGVSAYSVVSGKAAVNAGKVEEMIGAPEVIPEITPEALDATGKELDADIVTVSAIKGLFGNLLDWAKKRIPEIGIISTLLATAAGLWRKWRGAFGGGVRIAGTANGVKHDIEGMLAAYRLGTTPTLADLEVLVGKIKLLGKDSLAGAKDVKDIYNAMRKGTK